MKRLFAFATSLAVLPALWWSVYPEAAKFVERDSSGEFVRCFNTQSGMDSPVVCVKGDPAQLGLEKTVRSLAR